MRSNVFTKVANTRRWFVVYDNLNTKIREVDFFSTRLNKGLDIGISLLFALDIDLVSKFPLDYIHTYTMYT